jgi:hypothetical protein
MDQITDILSDRQSTHGDFSEVAKLDRAFKALLQKSPNWGYLSDTQALALEMIFHKLSRILSGNPNHPDHVADIQGYAELFKKYSKESR